MRQIYGLFVSMAIVIPAKADSEIFLDAEDFAAAATVQNVDAGNDQLERKTKYFEGDIKLRGSIDSYADRSSNGNIPSGVQRTVTSSRYAKWPNGQVAYALSSSYSRTERAVIAAAMQAITAAAPCINFVPRGSSRNYVYIFKDDGCYSEVGRVGGRQYLSLDNGCLYKGIAMHELMHVLGFFHEQSRPDRDSYITINWDNIMRGYDDQFEKYRPRQVNYLGAGYDYGSIMHYSANAFSRNGRATITPKQAGARLGQRYGLSSVDSSKLKSFYCNGVSDSGTGTGGSAWFTPQPRPPVTAAPVTLAPWVGGGCRGADAPVCGTLSTQFCTRLGFMRRHCCNKCKNSG